MKMRLFILFGILGAAVAAVPPRQQRIVGGEETTIETYPYMSNMVREYFGGTLWTFACGGTLITSTTIVSAASCYEGSVPAQWQVRLGSSHISSGGSMHHVSRVKMHEAYTGMTGNGAFENDLAMVYLATAAVFSDSVGVARVAGLNYILPAGTPVKAVGWGYLSSTTYLPEYLHHVDTYLIDHAICAQRYAELKASWGFSDWPVVIDGMICDGLLDVGGKGTCRGDDGGPLIHQGDVLVGITSWRYRCALSYYPGVNTRVSHYSDWIVENGSS